MFDYEKAEEGELVRRAARGDVKAFSRLYAKIYKDLYRFALFTTRHRQDAEDAVSEAVISAFEHISELKKEGSFRNWMFTILNRKCLLMLKRNQAEEKKYELLIETNPDHAVRYEIRSAFLELEEDERTILALSIFGGYKSEEIGAMLKKNPATVRSRKSRALEKMKRRLESDG